MDQNIATIIASVIAVIGTLGGAISGVLLSNNHTSKMEKLRIEQEEKKRKRALLDELCGACFKIQKLCNAAIDGVYPINEFTFEPLNDVKDRIMAIIIMDFEEKMIDAMFEYFEHIKKFEITIEEFHALYVVNPTLEDPIIKNKWEDNLKLSVEILANGVSFLKEIQKVSQKL
jgi:hypothetical protein